VAARCQRAARDQRGATDCYIALSLMSRQQFEIAAGVAQQTKDKARLHRVTGEGHKIKAPAAKRSY
jgi:hypothetical protein